MQFQPGDRVTITNPSPENEEFRGKTGTVEITDGPDRLVAVKGVHWRIYEAVLGIRCFYPEELTKG